MNIPANPKIYHIVHVENLASIVATNGLLPDATMHQRSGGTVIGMSHIKQRRMELPVGCHPGSKVGQYVPFYFCSRSVMLYVIHRANSQELAFKGGQEPIVHLEADLMRTIEWAQMHDCRWAFSLSNAGARYTQFRADVAQLGELNWEAIAAQDFRPAAIKEGKQAEFLIERGFPWELVERIGVYSRQTAGHVAAALGNAAHRPMTEILKNWYY